MTPTVKKSKKPSSKRRTIRIKKLKRKLKIKKIEVKKVISVKRKTPNKEMAKIVDDQNKNDSNYIKMSDDFENSIAFKTACDLVFKGKEQPSGYTEPLLHLNRLKKKSNLN